MTRRRNLRNRRKYLSFYYDCRVSCTSIEEKAKAEYDKVNEGMEEFNNKMKAIADDKAEKSKKQKKILK